MSAVTPRLYTTGHIAERLDQSLYRVQYAIRTRAIEPCGIAGNARVFSDEQVGRIAEAIREIDARRETPSR